MNLNDLHRHIISGGEITKEQALTLIHAPLNELKQYANAIREHFCKKQFDLCSIINAKCGRCTEDCKYCAQSSFYKTNITEYGLLGTQTIVKEAKNNSEKGVLRFSIVTSGRKPPAREIDELCQTIKEIKKKYQHLRLCFFRAIK